MQDLSSCPIVRAPAFFICSSPCAPSAPMPVMITPTALLPAYLATEWKSASTEGLCPETLGPSLICTLYVAPLLFSVMWKLPGAIKHLPGVTVSPSSASFMVICESEFSLSAKAFVKFAGICCTTTMPGIVAGRFGSTCCSASVPPVDVPMAITMFVVLVSEVLIGVVDFVYCVGMVNLFLHNAAAFIFCFRSTAMSPME